MPDNLPKKKHLFFLKSTIMLGLKNSVSLLQVFRPCSPFSAEFSIYKVMASRKLHRLVILST